MTNNKQMTHECRVVMKRRNGDIVRVMIVECLESATTAQAEKHYSDFAKIFCGREQIARVECEIRPKGTHWDDPSRATA